MYISICQPNRYRAQNAAGFFSLDPSSGLSTTRRFGVRTFRSVLSLCGVSE